MQINPLLAADLALLTAALYDPAAQATPDIAQAILVSVTNARRAVGSFLGLSITITRRGRARDRAGSAAPDTAAGSR